MFDEQIERCSVTAVIQEMHVETVEMVVSNLTKESKENS